MLNLKIETYLKFIFIISSISIIFAYFVEYILGHQPCNLCLIERIPYVLSIALIILNYKFKKKEKTIILILIITFVFSFMISFYHFGIEQGFFEESKVCGLKNNFPYQSYFYNFCLFHRICTWTPAMQFVFDTKDPLWIEHYLDNFILFSQ